MPRLSTSPDPIVEIFTTLMKAMVDRPAELKVNARSEPDGSIMVVVRVPKSDVGKLIGIGGRSARALRTLLMAVATTSGKRYSLDIANF